LKFKSQTNIAKEYMDKLLDNGVDNKQDLYDKTVDELKLPRPTVRRIARDLRTDYLKKINILNENVKKEDKK
jgi:hypothetical protein